jgi:hypothetical protein
MWNRANKTRLFLHQLSFLFVAAFGIITIVATGGSGGGDDSDDLIIDVAVEDNECNSGIGQNCDGAEGWNCEPNSGSPGNFSIFNSKLIFYANIGCQYTWEKTLCELDNTGTIKEIISSSNALSDYIIIKDAVYFFVSGPTDITKLYKYDGHDPVPVQTFSGWMNVSPMAYNDNLYFIYNTGLYSYDGANLPAIAGNTGSVGTVGNYIVYNNKLYFNYNTNNNTDLLCYTEATGQLNSEGNVDDYNFIIFQDKLFYVAHDDINGVQIWMIDNDNPPVMISNFPKTYTAVSPLNVLKDKFLCAVWPNTGTSSNLWEYDGVSFKPISFEGGYQGVIRGNIILNDHFYFWGMELSQTTDTFQYTLWDYDGINPPVKIVTEDNSISEIYSANGKLFFQGGETLYTYDGISEKEVFAELNNSAVKTISSIQYFNDTYYVTGYDANYVSGGESKKYYYGDELWKIDNNGNINLVKDFYPGTSCMCE